MDVQKLATTLMFPIVLIASICFGQAESTGMINGVNYSGFQNFGLQSCNFLNSSSYQCFENSLGQMLYSQIVSFNSPQELCNQMRSDGINSVTISSGTYAVASTVRATYVNANCTAYPTAISNNNGFPVNDSDLLANMKCSLSVEAIDGAFGNTGEMQIPITTSDMHGVLFAHMFKEKSLWIPNAATTRHSSKYVSVNYSYTKGTGGSVDQLTLRAVLNGVSTEVTGFAGSEVSLSIDNVDPVVKAVVTCMITDSNNPVLQTNSNNYICRTSGSDVVEKSPIAIELLKLLDRSLVFTTVESLNSVTMTPEGSFALRQGTAVFTATRNSSKSGLMNITARANLSTPVKFKVKRLSKSVDVSCK